MNESAGDAWRSGRPESERLWMACSGRKQISSWLSRNISVAFLAISATGISNASAQPKDFTKVTQATLENPPAADWLMFSRTYDAQRFSPLEQINTGNVASLQLAWSKTYGAGTAETIPIVHDGVMYLAAPGAIVQALDATSGKLLWQYQRKLSEGVANSARTKALAIVDDLIIYTAPDSYVVGIDARTGQQRWESKAGSRGHTSAPIVVNNMAISGGACFGNRDNCYLSAHDVHSGEELWRFYTTPKQGEPGDESWNGASLSNRQASTWGLPGSYDVKRKTLIWGIANAMPDRRSARHNGDPAGTSFTAPADLYSNSTVALDAAKGKLQWYYQHLPGDDWDFDATHERTLVTTAVAPDPRFVKWINPSIRPGELRDISVNISEGGGVWALDRQSGEFLWATAFPVDSPLWWLDSIDVNSGKVTIKKDLVFTKPGERRTLCFWNTRSYWPTAYSPQTNSLYTSYSDVCRDLTSASFGKGESWKVVPRPGVDPAQITGLAKINLSTGEVLRFDVGRAPSQGALLTTAGNLVFHGDMNRRFRAFDATTGQQLWESILGAAISVSTISYAVNGKQYIAVMTGETLKTPELAALVPELSTPLKGGNALYVFALP